MTTFQFWNGLDTIGGNIVEVKTDQARVICDFGLTGIGQDLGDTGGLSEAEFLLSGGYLPAIPGLYDTKGFQQVELASFEEDTRETAIFVSHLHIDHMGLLKYLPAGTKVYLSAESKALYETLIDIGEEQPILAELIAFEHDEHIAIGDIWVQPKRSDHDTVGICAFFVEAPGLRLIHSGDLRLTGEYPERVEQWVGEAREWQPDVLLLEGTSFSFAEATEEPEEERLASETELVANWRELLHSVPDEIVFYNPYIRNVDRLKRIAEVTAEEGRIFVFEAAYAQLLHAFYPSKKWPVLAEGEQTGADGEQVNLAELVENPGQYVLQNSFKNISRLRHFPGGVYAHSNGEPLGAYDPNYAVLLEKLVQHQFVFRDFSVSGHATQEHLLQIAKAVDAAHTVPWHTFEPERMHAQFLAEGISSFLPEKERLYHAEEVAAPAAEEIVYEGQ